MTRAPQRSRGVGVEQHDRTEGEQPPEDLHRDEGPHRARGDAGEGVAERARDGDRRVREGRARGEPVGGRDVGADGVPDPVLAPGPHDAEDDEHQAEGGHDLAQQQAGAGAVVAADVHRGQVVHEVRDDHPEAAAQHLDHDEAGSDPRGDRPEQPLDQRHHRVERRRHRAQREDQRDEDGTGDEGVLQQLQALVTRREARSGHSRPDDGGGQQRAAEQLGEGAAQHQQQVGSMTRHSAPRASRLAR
jgi:hypothetical protein